MDRTATVLFQAPDLIVGTVPGNLYYAPSYKGRLRVTVDVTVRRLSGTRETTEHEQVENPLEFAISAGVWNSRNTDVLVGGQCQAEVLPQVLAPSGTISPYFTRERLQALLDLDGYHLNGMRAGCAHQEPVYNHERGYRQVDLTSTKPCPQTGYRYGSGWLLQPLPEDLLDRLAEIFTNVPTDLYTREG